MPHEVQRVYATMVNAMGGAKAWAAARYFEFDYVTVRSGRESARWSYRWDRATGQYMLKGVQRSDSVVIISTSDYPLVGTVYVNREWIKGPRADSLLQLAYVRWVYDSYWLVMPFTWNNPGVHTQFLGREADSAGNEWDVVKLWFDLRGITYENQYIAFVAKSTGLMEGWGFIVRQGTPIVAYDWGGWQTAGGILLSTERATADRSLVIRYEGVIVTPVAPVKAFTADW